MALAPGSGVRGGHRWGRDSMPPATYEVQDQEQAKGAGIMDMKLESRGHTVADVDRPRAYDENGFRWTSTTPTTEITG